MDHKPEGICNACWQSWLSQRPRPFAIDCPHIVFRAEPMAWKVPPASRLPITLINYVEFKPGLTDSIAQHEARRR